MDGAHPDMPPHTNMGPLDPSARNSVAPNPSQVGAVSDAIANGADDNYFGPPPPPAHDAYSCSVPSPARTLLDLPRRDAAATTTTPAATATPNTTPGGGPTSGLDVLNTAAAAARTDDESESAREEAALALVGLTAAMAAAALPISTNANTGSTNGATPRPAGGAEHPNSATRAPTSVVTPGSGLPKPKPRQVQQQATTQKLTYVRGVGLVSGEIPAELSATIGDAAVGTVDAVHGIAASSASSSLAAVSAAFSSPAAAVPETPAPKKMSAGQKQKAAGQKEKAAKTTKAASSSITPATRRSKRTRGGAKKGQNRSEDASEDASDGAVLASAPSGAASVVTPGPTAAKAAATARTPSPPIPGAILQLRTDGWTNYELSRLMQGIDHHGYQIHNQDPDWEAVATFVGTRSAGQCRSQWDRRGAWERDWRGRNGRFLAAAARVDAAGAACGGTSPPAGAVEGGAEAATDAAVEASRDTPKADTAPPATTPVPEKRGRGRPRKHHSDDVATAADAKKKSPSKSTKSAAKTAAKTAPKKKQPQPKNKTKTKKKDDAPSTTTHTRKKTVTSDGMNTGDWNDAETARLQQGIRALGSGKWTEIAAHYVKTRTKKQCKSKNQKMVRSDGEDWYLQKFLTIKKRRWPASRPPPKRALDTGMIGPVQALGLASAGDRGYMYSSGPLTEAAQRLLATLPPLPPALPPALPPPQYEEEKQDEVVEEEKEEEEEEKEDQEEEEEEDQEEEEEEEREEQTLVTDAAASESPAAAVASSEPTVPTPEQEIPDTSGRRLSKRRPKRSVAEIREEFEARQELKQTMTRAKKVKVNASAKATMAASDATGDQPAAAAKKDNSAADSSSGQSRPTSRRKTATKAKKVAPAEKKNGGTKDTSVVSAKKPSAKHTSNAKGTEEKQPAKRGSKADKYPRCITPGCTRQRQGGCAGQCRKHYNQDRFAAGLELAPTYAKTCKVEGCNKLYQWGFGGYCRAHYGEEQTKANKLCSVPECKKLPVRGCDGMCTVHYRRQKKNPEKEYHFSRATVRSPDGNKGDWDDDEVQRLYEGISMRTRKGDWTVVAEHVGTRTVIQCKSKYQKLQLKQTISEQKKQKAKKKKMLELADAAEREQILQQYEF